MQLLIYAGTETHCPPRPIPPHWESRLTQDVLMFRRWGNGWRLLNRYHVLARAQGQLYGGFAWLEAPPRCSYRYGEEED